MSEREKLPGREVIWGVVFLCGLLLGLVVLVLWRAGKFDGWSSSPAPAANRPVRLDDLQVVRKIEVEGAPYLLWSNGQVTPDMAAHRKWVLRTMAAQAILEKQTEADRRSTLEGR